MNPDGGEAFERVRRQIGCCGIWCGSCAVGNGSLEELTTRYRDVLQSHGLDHWGPPDLNYAEFERGLSAIKRVASCAGCRAGGGRDNCELRACAKTRALDGCPECPDRSRCPHGQLLNHMRTGAEKAGLKVVDASSASEQFMKQLEGEIRSSWPGCVLFLPSDRCAGGSNRSD